MAYVKWRRRWLAAGLLLATCGLAFAGLGSDKARAVPPQGDVAKCVTLAGDAARECYRREVALQLAAIAGRPASEVSEPAGVDFDVIEPKDLELLCDLHARVGDADGVPGWLNGVAPSAVAGQL